MQVVIPMLVSACILSMVNSVPTTLSYEQRPNKYKAQLFDCGVPGKIQVLKVPETYREDSNKVGTNPLRKTYVLSPKKLKKASGVCLAISQLIKIHLYCFVLERLEPLLLVAIIILWKFITGSI